MISNFHDINTIKKGIPTYYTMFVCSVRLCTCFDHYKLFSTAIYYFWQLYYIAVLHILQTINTELRNKIKVNQWQNSSEVIEWFKNIPNKKECTFTVFDIQEFYPSITEDLLKQAILFAQNSVSIPPKYIDVIFHSNLFCTIMMIHGSKKILV